MKEYDRLIELAGSEEVLDGVNLPKIQLHKWLVLGQTEYVCEYGTLADGHEKLTPAQKYSQALKEQYYLAINMATQKSLGMEARADYLDAEEALNRAEKESDKLRAMAKLERAKATLINALTTVEDQTRMLKYYRNRAASLKEQVETRYPQGIEQAELDNWRAVAEYRRISDQTPGMARQSMFNIPLPAEIKAALGFAWDRPDMIAPLQVENRADIENNHNGSTVLYLQDKLLKQSETK